jgi:hypothetical protein
MKNSKNENSLSENSNYLLNNVTNYKNSIDNTTGEILNKFVRVLVEYMRLISETITMKNKQYYKFIFERGIETLIHIFSIIFYYTKNLELTFYHCQKAYYFYIEFIEQISDDNITFLQLSSRDAILFVYKKTIFDLNNDYRKNIMEPTNEEKNILSLVDSYSYIYKNIIQFIINHKDFTYDNKNEYINNCCNYIETFGENININKNKTKKNIIECIYLFTNLLADKQIEIKTFFNLLEEFIKKINIKKKINEKLIKNKIYDSEINNYIINNDLNKMIEWIFTI